MTVIVMVMVISIYLLIWKCNWIYYVKLCFFSVFFFFFFWELRIGAGFGAKTLPNKCRKRKIILVNLKPICAYWFENNEVAYIECVECRQYGITISILAILITSNTSSTMAPNKEHLFDKFTDSLRWNDIKSNLSVNIIYFNDMANGNTTIGFIGRINWKTYSWLDNIKCIMFIMCVCHMYIVCCMDCMALSPVSVISILSCWCWCHDVNVYTQNRYLFMVFQ